MKSKIKFVQKANMWCKTTIGVDKQGRKTQKQEWLADKPKEE